MTSANIIGDLTAIFVMVRMFPDITKLQILMMVAVVTIIMTIIGQIAGFYYVSKDVPLKYTHVFKYGRSFFTKELKDYFK